MVVPVVPVVEGDADQGLPVPDGGGHQGAPRLLREPGFHPHASLTAPKQLIMVDEGAAPNCDGPGGADLRHRLIFQARLGQQRHIVGGGVVVVVVEPAGVGKGAVFHPQLRRLLVHHRHKIRLAPRRVAGDGHSRVVSRLKQQAVQQSPQGDLLPRLQIDGRTLATQPLPFDAHYFIQVPRLLHRHQGGEQLRSAGDEPGLVDVVFIEHPAA